jgi:integrase
VRAFQVHLVSTGISWPALNQTVCALRFFYGVTLGHGEIPERIPYAREPRKLPVVLNADEVVRFLEAVPSLKTRPALTTAYAAGLRASEAVGPKIADIDSDLRRTEWVVYAKPPFGGPGAGLSRSLHPPRRDRQFATVERDRR